MTLARKDVRAKLDPEYHEALVAICEADEVDIGEFVEAVLVRVVDDRLHKASVIAKKTSGLGISGKTREPSGGRK